MEQDKKRRDERDLVKLLMDFWFTEVKAKIYLYLRKAKKATAEGIAKGAGIYITSVREAVAEMYHEGWIKREKVKKSGLGKPAYIYEALPPRSLVRKLTEGIKKRLDKLLILDHFLEEEKTK